MRILNLIFILLLVISLSEKTKKKNPNKHPKKEKYNSKDELENIYSWAKKHNIFINDKLHLNKNINASHNFYFFTSSDQIPNNTLLLRVPYDIMISQSSLEKHFQEKRSKKFAYLWDKIIENKNPYISYFSTKQYFYMSIIIEDAISKKRGAIYNKYKPYFDMYEYMNMDIFPVFYDEEEIYFLAPSSFGTELKQAVESLKEEYYIINNDLQLTDCIQDNFLKYRVLALANSVSFNNTKLNDRNDFNESVIVPFIDCFRKVALDFNASAKFKIVLDTDNKYYLEIRSIKDIEKNSEINLKWRKISNGESLIYYGFIEKGNYIAPKMDIILFNNMFRKDLGVDENKDLRDIMQRSRYELNTEFFNQDVVRTYKNLSKLFDKYKKPEGLYEMMRDNLLYYLDLYDNQYTEGNINLYIKGNEKRKYIKSLMKIEKLVVQRKLEYVNNVINDIKTGVATPPDDL